MNVLCINICSNKVGVKFKGNVWFEMYILEKKVEK